MAPWQGVLRQQTPHPLGLGRLTDASRRFFGKELGVHVGGLLVQHVGEDRGAAVWSIAVAYLTEKDARANDTATASRFTVIQQTVSALVCISTD